MITVQEIKRQLDSAIKTFGEYTYQDRGAEEIMDLDPIEKELRDSNDVAAVIEIFEELDRDEQNFWLLSDLIGRLDDWDEL